MGKKRQLSLSESSDDEDVELQEALASGNLQPGVYREFEVFEKPPIVNKAGEMKLMLDQFKLNLDPIERLDFVNSQGFMNPEMELEIQRKEEQRAKSQNISDISKDPVLNDFKRETGFYRQAQESVLKAVNIIESLNISFERPHDYFAEMVKSDDHMHKVRQSIAKKLSVTEKVEKARQIRQQKKEQKQLLKQQKIDKQQTRHQIKEEVKKLKKKTKSTVKVTKRVRKDEKFGFGGKKRGLKRNSKDSSNFTEKRKSLKTGSITRSKNRPGKRRRQQMHSRKKH